MPYRYETHMHTCFSSACGVSTGAEHARFYKDTGYTGIIITDHFYGGNCAVDRSLPWPEFVDRFCVGYEDATEAADIYTELQKLVEESFSNFVRNGVTDESWNSFLAQAEAIGSARYIELYQNAYDAYLAK